MFQKLVTAIEPFGLTMVVLAGLMLMDRIEVADRAIVGLIIVIIGVVLSIAHVFNRLGPVKTKKEK